MPTIFLTHDKVAVVDDCDAWVLNFPWFLHNEGFAMRNVPDVPRECSGDMEYLHHAILPLKIGYQTKFKDGNKLNCRRSNLELISISDARRSARPRKNGSSKYKGVSLHKKNGKWLASIRINHKATYLGLFVDEEAAARAYDAAVKEHCDGVGYLNFPDPNPSSKEVKE